MLGDDDEIYVDRLLSVFRLISTLDNSDGFDKELCQYHYTTGKSEVSDVRSGEIMVSFINSCNK